MIRRKNNNNNNNRVGALSKNVSLKILKGFSNSQEP